MATTGSNKTEIDQIKTWINSVIQNSLLPAELAAQTTIDDVNEVSILQKGTDDAKGVATALLRGYQGTWNAATNTPTLIDGTGIELDKFFVSADGSVDLGSGTMSFKVGDRVEYINGVWYKRNGGGIELSLNTGRTTGGEVTENAGDNTKFDVAAGTGYILDWTNPLSPKGTFISWSAFIAVDLPDIGTTLFSVPYIIESATPGIGEIDLISGALITPQERRQKIQLQSVIHTNLTSITSIGTSSKPSYESVEACLDYILALGTINSGNQILENGANLQLNKAIGTSTLPFINEGNDPQNPAVKTNIAQTGFTFTKSYQDGSGGFVFDTGNTEVDPDLWDDGSGVLATVPNNRYSVKHFIFFGANEAITMTYGQETYSSLADAELAISTENPNISPLLNSGVCTTVLAVKKGVTDLAAAVAGGTAEFVDCPQSGNAGGAASVGNFVTQDTDQLTGNTGDKKWEGAHEFTNSIVLNKGTSFNAQIGEASTVNGMMYLSTDGKWYNTNADDVAKSSTRIAMSTEVGSANDTIVFLKEGLQSGLSGLTAGDNYYLDESDGSITNDISGFASGYIGRLIGTAESTTELRFNPDVTYIEIF